MVAPIRVIVQTYPSEYGDDGFAVAEDAATAIRGGGTAHPVEVVTPQGAPFDILQTARTLFIEVPWDDVGLLVVGALLESLREWLTDRVKRARAEGRFAAERIDSLPTYFFPEEATREEKAERLRTTAYQVMIYGPNARPLAIVQHNETMDEVVVIRNPTEAHGSKRGTAT